MENERCGSKGWTRVALVDMSNKAQSCPGDLTLISSPIRTCGGPTTAGCTSAKFSTHGMSYSQVCGRLRGYQVGETNAFGPYVNDQINLNLVMDGVLISHGKTQKHTSGLMLLVFRKLTLILITTILTVHVLTTDIMVLFHHSLEMTTIVIVQLRVIQKLASCTLHHCGLVEDVFLQISAAPIVECRGFVRLYLFPLLTTLRYVTVSITHSMKTQPWS